MAKRKPEGESYSNRLLFDRSSDPVFVLNNRRRLRYANPAWEKLARQSLEDAYNLHCIRDRRASPLAQALSPPPEVLAGNIGQTRRAAPPSKVGPPWWDISFLPLMGPEGLLGIVGRIAVVGSSSGPRTRSLPEGLVQLRHRLIGRYTFAGLESDRPAFDRIAEQARLASRNNAPIAIVGEPGSGKSFLARAIHYQGISAEKSFIPIDCSALSVTATEYLLFGEAGLASPERVGSIYLRGAAALPRELQLRLLTRLSQSHDDSPRVIAGFSADPVGEVASGRLLDELDMSLRIQVIQLLPLRARLAELPKIAEEFLQRIDQGAEQRSSRISAAAIDQLREYEWPGNLRELASVLANAAKTARGGQIEPEHLPESLRGMRPNVAKHAAHDRQMPLAPTLKDVQRRLILFALWRSRGQKAAAARYLDLSRSELWRRMGEMNIGDDEWRTLEGKARHEDALPPDHPV